ncbi:MAG: HDIG domain-containing protein [Desulfovibrio sp.]|jgi:putative nucleotidyltransferase with HDIG domain|nr:HDIG domain-containing protein [Desulfovibrio sp.]
MRNTYARTRARGASSRKARKDAPDKARNAAPDKALLRLDRSGDPGGSSVAAQAHRAPASRREEPLPDLPDLDFPEVDMELFDPAVHLPDEFPLTGDDAVASRLLSAAAVRHSSRCTLIPRCEDCRALWDRYAMLGHIREHSAKVADFAHALAVRAVERGMKVNPDAVRAAGLLHDLGKTRTIAVGGNHAQLGAAWVMRETRNGQIAGAVLFHVFWPFEGRLKAVAEASVRCPERPGGVRGGQSPAGMINAGHFMIAAVIYADKRTLHDAYVGLDARCEDLIRRYAVSEAVKKRILLSHEQGRRIEAVLSAALGVELQNHVAVDGRLFRAD